MKLKDWRKKKKLSQEGLARALDNHARDAFQNEAPEKPLAQTTLGYWERGTRPGNFWIRVIRSFTKEQVCADDFVPDEDEYGAQQRA